MQLTIKPTFVKTVNVRNFESMMNGLGLSAGEGRFGLVWGRAGRGKTRTAQYYCANTKNCKYVLALRVWRYSQGELLKAIAREIGIINPPHRIGRLFADVAERLMIHRPSIFIDEPDKLTLHHLEIIRDLTEFTGAPFILIGEEELPDMMKRERRIWSRTYQQVQFHPFTAADIIQYINAAAGVRLLGSSAVDAILQKSEGDIRVVRSIFTNLVQVLNAKGVSEADDATVEAAIRQTFPEF
jgi:DNA transposition AAA+ family ATPase